jgi:hypothetical protein
MDPGTTLMFVVLFGTVAICCCLVVLKAWILERRLPAGPGGWAMASAIVMALTLATAAPAYHSAEQARVDAMHRQFAPALERYRKTHGEYPSTLQEAGIATPQTRYGPLHYYGSRSETDPWYLISFGDIERHRFSADWDSRTRKWTLVGLDF